ncbi:MAG TPA: hypothetical protein VGW38_29265 [Chloroflexota bacterium]|nr:hypothetical protein [Chloroflexota bacterium]
MAALFTLFLQALGAALQLLFGILALATARHQDAFLPVRREAWWLTGATFTLLGAIMLVHTAIGSPWAYFSGPGTTVYEVYLRWSPVGNHSRALLIVGFGVLLLLLVWRQQLAHFRQLAVAVLLLAALLGGIAGWLEGSLIEARHFTLLAIGDTLQLMVISAALLSALWLRMVDEHLWLCLSLYALMLALNVGWYSAMAWLDVPGAWVPTSMHMQMCRQVAYLGMLAFVLRRLVLARRGVQVPAFTDPEPEPEFSTFG